MCIRDRSSTVRRPLSSSISARRMAIASVTTMSPAEYPGAWSRLSVVSCRTPSPAPSRASGSFQATHRRLNAPTHSDSSAGDGLPAFIELGDRSLRVGMAGRGARARLGGRRGGGIGELVLHDPQGGLRGLDLLLKSLF